MPEQHAHTNASHDSINIPNTPQSIGPSKGYEQVFAGPNFNNDNNQPELSSTSQPQITTSTAANWTAANQMDLDSDTFAFLNNMEDFTQGGLTGLEDWTEFSTDLGPVQDFGDWPATATSQQQQQQQQPYR